MKRCFPSAWLACLLTLAACGGGSSAAEDAPIASAASRSRPSSTRSSPRHGPAARPTAGGLPRRLLPLLPQRRQPRHRHRPLAAPAGHRHGAAGDDLDAPAGTAWSDEVWAPELQFLRGKWYVYFAASDGRNATHRCTCSKASRRTRRAPMPSRDAGGAGRCVGYRRRRPRARRRAVIRLVGPAQRCRQFPQVLYIAPMSDPWTISGERHGSPRGPCLGAGGRGVARRPGGAAARGALHLAYSASASWSDDYALGLLTYRGGDILSASSWVKADAPAFTKRPEAGVWGPGHNSFVRSPDDSED